MNTYIKLSRTNACPMSLVAGTKLKKKGKKQLYTYQESSLIPNYWATTIHVIVHIKNTKKNNKNKNSGLEEMV